MLRYRVVSSIISILLVILVAHHLPAVATWVLLGLISCLCQLEFYNMVNKAGIPVFRVIGILCGTALISTTFLNLGPAIGPEPGHLRSAYMWENVVLVLSLIIIFVRQFPQKNNDKPLSTIACTLFGIMYVPFLINFFTRLAFLSSGANAAMRVDDTGRLLVYYLILIVKSGDMGAYFTGRACGRHKLFPRISPNKTWEGLAGGVLLGIFSSLIFMWIANFRVGEITCFRWYDAVILGILLTVGGAIGDMFESLVKRASGVKDSGTLIPGMGGLLDVLDSLLFGAPILYVYICLFV